MFVGVHGSASRSKFPGIPEQPCWLYSSISLQQHSPLPRRFYPSENWLSSRCLTSVIIGELVFPSCQQPLTKSYHFAHIASPQFTFALFLLLFDVSWPISKSQLLLETNDTSIIIHLWCHKKQRCSETTNALKNQFLHLIISILSRHRFPLTFPTQRMLFFEEYISKEATQPWLCYILSKEFKACSCKPFLLEYFFFKKKTPTRVPLSVFNYQSCNFFEMRRLKTTTSIHPITTSIQTTHKKR